VTPSKKNFLKYTNKLSERKLISCRIPMSVSPPSIKRDSIETYDPTYITEIKSKKKLVGLRGIANESETSDYSQN